MAGRGQHAPQPSMPAALGRAGLPPVDKAARLLLGAATVVVGSPATDPVPDPALPHVGALTWGDPLVRLGGRAGRLHPGPGRSGCRRRRRRRQPRASPSAAGQLHTVRLCPRAGAGQTSGRDGSPRWTRFHPDRARSRDTSATGVRWPGFCRSCQLSGPLRGGRYVVGHGDCFLRSVGHRREPVLRDRRTQVGEHAVVGGCGAVTG